MVNIYEAKANLSRLVEQASAGEEIIIAKAGRLVPVEGARRPVKIGGLKPGAAVPDDFNTMFENEIEAAFAALTSPNLRKRK
ncbi:MAG TPA: type II toxin-antitoxin system prevent-host-death family antitoxin [Usitatibacter sp.]|nr:type II toxin-antitoxin system prevent-host-death family antitoxin [Usitatibacter sp.]